MGTSSRRSSSAVDFGAMRAIFGTGNRPVIQLPLPFLDDDTPRLERVTRIRPAAMKSSIHSGVRQGGLQSNRPPPGLCPASSVACSSFSGSASTNGWRNRSGIVERSHSRKEGSLDSRPRRTIGSSPGAGARHAASSFLPQGIRSPACRCPCRHGARRA